MRYYKVKPKMAQRTISGRTLVNNELYTLKELERYNINVRFFDIIELSKSKIYWSFGCRFESKK